VYPARLDRRRARAFRLSSLAFVLGAALLLSPGIPHVETASEGGGRALAATAKRPTIVVYKSKRRLLYFENDILKRRYPIVLGKRPEGQKVRRGDNRTPEGKYYITHKSAMSRFYRFLGLSYPNIDDAHRGLRGNLITQGDFLKIKTAIDQRQRPPSGTGLGGLIGIHGEGEYRDFTKRHQINWTEGCISVSDEDMRVLYVNAEVGTPVIIFP
jgi:murein L,D-transpeptidase YafK